MIEIKFSYYRILMIRKCKNPKLVYLKKLSLKIKIEESLRLSTCNKCVDASFFNSEISKNKL